MITSNIDNDIYKITQQCAVLRKYPHAIATYHFTNRRLSNTFTSIFRKSLQAKIDAMASLRMSKDEYDFIRERCPYLPPDYFEYIARYEYNPREVKLALLSNGQLDLSVHGLWHRTILWEVPLLALISETFFEEIDKNWTQNGQYDKLVTKTNRLIEGYCHWADFGTRRRRNYETQDTAVRVFKEHGGDNFVGTSNVHLAMKYNVKPIGTQDHEWTMAHSVLAGLRHANRYALNAWADVYQGELGTALTDTYGSDAFLKDFDGNLSRLYDGVRHDSGCPFKFIDKMVVHYKSKRLDPMSKLIVFSDGLDVEKAIEIERYCRGKIKRSFGIGTHFTNDFEGSPALNIVIKMSALNGIPVVKLSDVATKATGDKDAVRVANWTLFNTPLDNNLFLDNNPFHDTVESERK